jgi:hypothetical protein
MKTKNSSTQRQQLIIDTTISLENEDQAEITNHDGKAAIL